MTRTMGDLAFVFLTFWPAVALSFPDRYVAHARDPLITQAPRIDDHPLFARGDVATCGFVSGNAKSPLTCPTSYSCTSTVQDMVGWACCDQIQCAGNYYTCVNYGEQLCGGLDAAGCSSIYTSILSCSSADPSCFSYARSLSLNAESTYYSLACGQATGTVLALQTSLGGKSLAAGAGGPATAASSTVPGQANPSSPAGSSSGSSSGSGSTSSPTPSSSSGLSAGEKGGIAVASAAIVVAVVVGWWKKHQVLWLVTCGQRGYRYSVRPPQPQQPQAGHRLNTLGYGGGNNVGGNHVTNVGRWGAGSGP